MKHQNLFFVAAASFFLSATVNAAPAKNTSANVLNMLNAEGKPVGQVKIKEAKDGLVVSMDLKGIPAGTHGMHLHQNGKCEGPKFESAGGHFNPTQKKHGSMNAEGPHLGDLPNLIVPTDGTVKKDVTVPGVTLKKGPNSIATASGTSLIIHAAQDDLKTDPSGNSGDRLFCVALAAPENP